MRDFIRIDQFFEADRFSCETVKKSSELPNEIKTNLYFYKLMSIEEVNELKNKLMEKENSEKEEYERQLYERLKKKYG